jgi:hypothetical protein
LAVEVELALAAVLPVEVAAQGVLVRPAVEVGAAPLVAQGVGDSVDVGEAGVLIGLAVGRKAAQVGVHHFRSFADRLNVVERAGQARVVTAADDAGQHHAREDRDDDHHHDQLDQAEAGAAGGREVFHGGKCGEWKVSSPPAVVPSKDLP